MVYKTNKELAVVLITSLIGVGSLTVGMIRVRKWFSLRNTVVTISTLVSKVPKKVAGAILLFSTIRGGETVETSGNQKECTIKIEITWHEVLIMTVYEVCTIKIEITWHEVLIMTVYEVIIFCHYSFSNEIV